MQSFILQALQQIFLEIDWAYFAKICQSTLVFGQVLSAKKPIFVGQKLNHFKEHTSSQ